MRREKNRKKAKRSLKPQKKQMGPTASRCEICGTELSAKQVSVRMPVCGQRCAEELERRNGTNLKEIYENLRADAGTEAPHQSPEVTDTGLFETRMPRHPGHLVDYFMERREGLPFLREADAFYDLAAEEIQRQGFPLKPQNADLLKAPAPVLECYQLRDAYEQLMILRSLFLAPGVMKAAAAELAEEYGKPPTEPPWQQIQAGLDEATATKEFGQLLNAATEIGVLGQRLIARKHEEDVLRGRGTLEYARKGHAAEHGTPEEKKRRYAKYQAELDRVRKSNPKLTRNVVAQRVAEKFVAEGFRVTKKTIINHTTW
jgi:hypothetical protein